MRKFSLDALARNHLSRAADSSAGRSSETVYGGHERTLRQTLIALTANNALGEYPNPGDATLTVVRGRIRLAAGGDTWEARTGDMLILPERTHRVTALEDSAFVLTVAMGRGASPGAAREVAERRTDVL